MHIPAPGSPGWSRLVDLVAGIVLVLIVVPAAVLLFGDWNLVTTVIGGVFWLAGMVLLARLLRREKRRHPVLAAFSGPRLVLLFGSVGALVARRPDSGNWVWPATGLVLLSVLGEPVLRVLLGRAVPVAIDLPGVPRVPAAPFSPDLLVVGSLVAAAAAAVLAVVAGPGWVFLVVAGLVAGLAGVLAAHALAAARTSARSHSQVRPALERYRPEFVLYYAGFHGTTYQLGMWLPYLERLGRPFVVIATDPAAVPAITALTSTPVLVPQRNSTQVGLSQLVVPTMKAAFYVAGHPDNLNLQRFDGLTHVWLNHGDSDKKANFSPRHATFDKIFVAGQQGIDRYAAHGVKVRPDQFVVVGRPQIERIAFRSELLPTGLPRTVLYAPTWLGGRPNTSYSSLHLGPRIVTALITRGVTVIFRPHPLSHRDPDHAKLIAEVERRLESDRTSSGRQHVWGARAETEWGVPDCFNAADALITDVSSLASDFLASGKPLAMVAIRQRGSAFRRAIPMARVSYVIESDLSNLAKALDKLLGPDPRAQARAAYRVECLGDEVGPQAAQGFLRAVTTILDRDERAADRVEDETVVPGGEGEDDSVDQAASVLTYATKASADPPSSNPPR